MEDLFLKITTKKLVNIKNFFCFRGSCPRLNAGEFLGPLLAPSPLGFSPHSRGGDSGGVSAHLFPKNPIISVNKHVGMMTYTSPED